MARYTELEKLVCGLGFHQRILNDWCLARYGRDAHKVIRENPWCLLVDDAPSAGYKRVSALADRCGVPLDAMERIAFFCWSVCNDANGHTWRSLEHVLNQAREQFRTTEFKPALTWAKQKKVLEFRNADGIVWVADRRRAEEEEQLSIEVGRVLQCLNQRTGQILLNSELVGLYLSLLTDPHDSENT